MKYNAFISYSHQNSILAECLEKALEKFAKPTFKRRALEIFRDSNDLSASPDLWGKIEEGLNESEYFIFLASPAAAQSRWCKKEVDHWLNTKSIDQFLVVITDGDLVWDEGAADFDWTKTTALPENLSGCFNNDPLYIDFRGDPPEEELTLEHPEFKDKLVHLAATLHGMAVGDMVGEAVKQHKRTLRLRNTAIATLSTLLVIAVSLSIYATHQKILAQLETRKALLLNYISASQGQLSEDPTKSLRLAEYAYRYAKKNDLPSDNASEQLIKVYYSGYGFYQQNDGKLPSQFLEKKGSDIEKDYSPFKDQIDKVIASVSPRINNPKGPFSAFYRGSKSSHAEFLIAGGMLDFPRLYTFNFQANGLDSASYIELKLEGFGGFTGYIESVTISSDGRYSLLGATNSKTALIDNAAYLRDSKNADIYKTRYILLGGDKRGIFHVEFSDDNQYFITQSHTLSWTDPDGHGVESGSVTHLWKTEPFPYIEIHNSSSKFQNNSIVGGYYMVPDAADLDKYTWFHYAQAIRDRQNKLVTRFADAHGVTEMIVASPQKKYLLNNRGVFNKEKELLIDLSAYWFEVPSIAYCFSEDDKFFKISLEDERERIFPLDPEFILERINNPEIMGNIAELDKKDINRFLIETAALNAE